VGESEVDEVFLNVSILTLKAILGNGLGHFRVRRRVDRSGQL